MRYHSLVLSPRPSCLQFPGQARRGGGAASELGGIPSAFRAPASRGHVLISTTAARFSPRSSLSADLAAKQGLISASSGWHPDSCRATGRLSAGCACEAWSATPPISIALGHLMQHYDMPVTLLIAQQRPHASKHSKGDYKTCKGPGDVDPSPLEVGARAMHLASRKPAATRCANAPQPFHATDQG